MTRLFSYLFRTAQRTGALQLQITLQITQIAKSTKHVLASVMVEAFPTLF